MEDKNTHEPEKQSQSHEAHEAAPAPAPGSTGLTPSFSLLKPSLHAINVNLGVFISLYLLPFLLAIVLVIASVGFGGRTDPASTTEAAAITPVFIVLIVALVVVALVLNPILYVTQLASIKGQEVSLGEVAKKGMHFVGRIFGLSLLVSLMVVGGLILLIVPGVIFLRRYLLSPYYLIDRDLSISEAMRQSAAESKSYAGSIYGLFGVNVCFSLISVIPLIGGLIGSVLQLLYSCAPAIRYREISTATGYKSSASSPMAPVSPV